MTLTKDPRPAFKQLLAFAHELADGAGTAILPHFRRRIAVDNKSGEGGYDPVTIADRAAERRIAKAIAQRYPDHGLVGEEYGSVNPGARWRWIVDPIDGTRAFVMGSPLWGTLIGLMDADMPVLGMMDQPFTGERFWSGAEASFMRERAGAEPVPIRTRACAGLGEAIFSTTHPDLFAAGHEQAAFQRLKAKARMTRYGGDCYAYCMLAAGFVDVVVEAGLKPHDVVALIPIIERAGGRITTWEGRPAAEGGRIAACGDARLHGELLATLAG
jgi:myo-inositol-1(or 4)-monophosphatase